MTNQTTTQPVQSASGDLCSDASALPLAPLAMPKQVLTLEGGISRRAFSALALMIEGLKHNFRRAG